ncbi:MAG: tRNA (adenosine(37)-N6)-dimethylallyltransferase MiaA [Verrucomicrobiota bacterium]
MDWSSVLRRGGIKQQQDTPFFVLGPTAVGKSELALDTACAWGAEVISMDAFQVYKGLDIGTGKVSSDDQARVKHHLLDVVGPHENFHVARYLELVSDALAEIRQGQVPVVFVGGTGLYYRALRRGLTRAPVSEPEIVNRLETLPLDRLKKMAIDCDPEWAQRKGSDLGNTRRLIRVIAVFQDTGKPLSQWQKEMSLPLCSENSPAQVICLVMETNALRKRIQKRVQKMWSSGWLEEVEQLMMLADWQGSQSYQALGYAQVEAFLLGKVTKDEAINEIVTKTSQFAKRQMTWWRKEKVPFFEL